MLNQKFSASLEDFYFVSNTSCYDTQSLDALGTSPVQLLACVQSSQTLEQLHPNEDMNRELTKGFNKLVEACECTPEALYAVLKRTKLIKGPPLPSEGMLTLLSHEHLAGLPECQGFQKDTLNLLRDDVISCIHRASSLYTSDPALHYFGIHGNFKDHPHLTSKRIQVEEFKKWIQSRQEMPFEFTASAAPIELGSLKTKSKVLEQKLNQGGLGEHVETIQTRSLMAEAKLFELASRFPDKIDTILNHLSQMVTDTTLDAKLDAKLSSGNEPFGPRMLSDTYKQFRKDLAERPELYYKLHFEHLVGIAGLLTADCKIWWSEKFTLKATL